MAFFAKNNSKIGLVKRRISILAYCHVLFGEFKQQMGWWFFAIGMMFFWAFAANMDVTALFYFHREIENAQGIILSVSHTDASEQFESSPSRPIMAYQYTFTAENGLEYDNVSYSNEKKVLRKGDLVTIEYPSEKPDISHIKGMRNAIFRASPAMALIIMFPLAGLVLLVPGLMQGFRANRLLKTGQLSLGKLRTVIPIKSKFLKMKLYLILFKVQTVENSFHNISVRRNITWTDRDAKLLFHLENPSSSMLLIDLPGPPVIHGNKSIVCRNRKYAVLSLLLPIITIIFNGVYALFYYLR